MRSDRDIQVIGRQEPPPRTEPHDLQSSRQTSPRDEEGVAGGERRPLNKSSLPCRGRVLDEEVSPTPSGQALTAQAPPGSNENMHPSSPQCHGLIFEKC